MAELFNLRHLDLLLDNGSFFLTSKIVAVQPLMYLLYVFMYLLCVADVFRHCAAILRW